MDKIGDAGAVDWGETITPNIVLTFEGRIQYRKYKSVVGKTALEDLPRGKLGIQYEVVVEDFIPNEQAEFWSECYVAPAIVELQFKNHELCHCNNELRKAHTEIVRLRKILEAYKLPSEILERQQGLSEEG